MQIVTPVLHKEQQKSTAGLQEAAGTEEKPRGCCDRPCSPSASPLLSDGGTFLKQAERCWPASGPRPSHPGLNPMTTAGTGLSAGPPPSGPTQRCRSSLRGKKDTSLINKLLQLFKGTDKLFFAEHNFTI